MLVGDLIYNNEFDCNCNYIVYDCTEEGKQWGNEEDIVYSTLKTSSKPLDSILDMRIKYITTNNNMIIIEATK